MTERKGACCSSSAAMCYWFAASLIAWGVLSLVGIYWHPLHALSAATILFAMAIGCVANWLRNRTFHCGITGPLFLIAAWCSCCQPLAWFTSTALLFGHLFSSALASHFYWNGSTRNFLRRSLRSRMRVPGHAMRS
jgi:hypothetical protein